MPPPAARMVDKRRSSAEGEVIVRADEGVGSGLAEQANANANSKPSGAGESIRVPSAMTANNEEHVVSLGEAAQVREKARGTKGRKCCDLFFCCLLLLQ